MSDRGTKQGIWTRLRGLLRNRKGSVATTFAIVAVPLIISVGVGVDVSRVVSSRNNLQDALDAAALAIGRMPSNTPTATLQSQAQYWVNANLSDKNMSTVNLTVTATTTTVDLSATSSIPSAVVGLIGVQTLPVKGHSQTQRNLNHIELALVLDNTGSMNDDSKLSSLKTAATSLIDTLQASATASGDANALKVGVVPFSMTVNIGSSYQGQTWLTGKSPYGNDIFNTSNVDRFSILSTLGVTWGGCVESRPMPYDVQDTAPSTSIPNTMFVPFFWPDEPDDNYAYNSNYDAYSNNYMPDKSGDTTWQAKQGDKAKYVKKNLVTGTSAWSGYNLGPNGGCQMQPLSRLTTDTASIKTKINAMVAVGDTEIPIGMMWGWHVLSPNAPFADGTAYGTTGVIKIVVLVTDGQNTYSTNYNNQTAATDGSFYTALGYIWQNRISTDAGSYASPALALNDRLAKVCANMKASKVVVYTVPLEVTDATVKSLLQGCASSSDKYLDVSSASGLQAAFTNIAGSISALRVSK